MLSVYLRMHKLELAGLSSHASFNRYVSGLHEDELVTGDACLPAALPVAVGTGLPLAAVLLLPVYLRMHQLELACLRMQVSIGTYVGTMKANPQQGTHVCQLHSQLPLARGFHWQRYCYFLCTCACTNFNLLFLACKP